METFARTVYEAYTSFRTAGFEDSQAFQLARDFMAAAVRENARKGEVTE